MISKRKLALYSLTAVLAIATQTAIAHTGVKDTTTEGSGYDAVYTAFTITHGCSTADNPEQLPVIAQSVVFPNNEDSIAFRLKADGTDGEAIDDLSKYIVGAVGTAPISLGISGVQDKSVFNSIEEVANDAGTPHALHLTQGKLQANLVGLIPFRASRLGFVKSSCAKNIQVRIAIANWCNTSSEKSNDRRVDLWMGQMTSKFDDPGVMPHENTEVYWPTLTIERDLKKNPLPENCGNGFDIAVQPSEADINKYLPIKGYWPAN